MRILLRQMTELLFHSFRNDTVLILKYEVITSNNRFFAIDRCRNTVCNDIFYFGVHLLVIQIFLSCRVYYGFCHGMRKMLFQAGCDAQKLIRALCFAEGYHLCYGRLRFCQCSGLIENDRIRFRHSLQEFTALYGDLVLVCLADCRENGNRHGKF